MRNFLKFHLRFVFFSGEEWTRRRGNSCFEMISISISRREKIIQNRYYSMLSIHCNLLLLKVYQSQKREFSRLHKNSEEEKSLLDKLRLIFRAFFASLPFSFYDVYKCVYLHGRSLCCVVLRKDKFDTIFFLLDSVSGSQQTKSKCNRQNGRKKKLS